jgi:hypothetical protein
VPLAPLFSTPLVPWIITLGLSGYVYFLTYHAQHSLSPDPSYEFYDTTQVRLLLPPSEEPHEIYAHLTTILEGRRELVAAVQAKPGMYRLTFNVNSPRPAVVFIDNEALEIFLVPGDTSLALALKFSRDGTRLDSVAFRGKHGNLSAYYRDKMARLGRNQVRTPSLSFPQEPFSAYAAKLDSMAARELAFLAEREIFAILPDWFASFEKNEILYQKAYLKLNAAYNRQVPETLLDQVPLNNSGAVFSYYYYLYLNAFIARRHGMLRTGDPETLRRQVATADSLLQGDPHDIFLTRMIFQAMDQQQLELAAALLDQYEPRFSSNRYSRFLRAQLKTREAAAQAQPVTR